ncbi:MAG: HAMP domain-containing sensor histidine kinase [Eubacteriales bacterium]|nr:HAMP domain-containing sensor histidine kinase [Eubacteriales bacterium]
MLKKVQLRFTLFCSLAAAVILFVMTAFCLVISERGLKNKNYADFQNNTSSILTYLDSQSTLSHTWLSQMENRYRLTIDIRDGDSPLLYGTLHEHSLLADTLAAARETASEQYNLSAGKASNRVLLSQETFCFHNSQGQGYFATVALLPKGNGFLDVAMISPDDTAAKQILMQRFLFGAGAFAAFAALTVFAWFFTGRTLRPVEESRRSQASFIAAASHELRAPLAVMLSSLSAVRDASPDDQPRFFDAIESEGTRMSRLISDMLLLANSDSHTWTMALAPAEADTLLLETYEKYEIPAGKKGLRLEILLPEETVPPCMMDKERIAQTLSILIENAISYTPKGGTVTLCLEVSPKHLTFSVSDNGPGIPDPEKEKIFERFYRSDSAHHDRDHFGLGLCIAREIVHLHKGKIQAKDAPGGGCVFTVTLPLSQQSLPVR